MSNDFDPEEFMNVTVEGELDTKRPVIPAAQYHGQIYKVTPKGDVVKDGPRAGKPWRSLLLSIEILDEAVLAEIGQDRFFVSHNVFLDVDDNGQLLLGKGQNVELGKVRAAVGQNDGSAWSPAMLLGQHVTVDVTVGINRNNGDEVNNVRGVAEYTGM